MEEKAPDEMEMAEKNSKKSKAKEKAKAWQVALDLSRNVYNL